MAYRITYGPKIRAEKRQPKSRGWMIAAVGALAIVLYVAGAWDTLKDWLLPGDAAVTESALQTLTQQVEEGVDLGQAFAAFCREIIENAQIH